MKLNNYIISFILKVTKLSSVQLFNSCYAKLQSVALKELKILSTGLFAWPSDLRFIDTVPYSEHVKNTYLL